VAAGRQLSGLIVTCHGGCPPAHAAPTATAACDLASPRSTMENALLGDSMIEKLRASGTTAEKEKEEAMRA
jgi:hypothetical protein